MQLRCGPIFPDALPLDHAAVEQPAHGALAAPVALAQTMPPRRPQMERVESPKQLPAHIAPRRVSDWLLIANLSSNQVRLALAFSALALSSVCDYST